MEVIFFIMDKFLSSKDVAEVLGKRHDNLLRAIRKYCEALEEDAPKHFILEGEGRKSTCKVTYLGCELLAGRMIGQAGDEFKLWYKGILEEPVEEPKDPEDKLYTVAEVADMLDIGERSVYRNIKSGKLDAVEREVMVPTVRKFVPAEALERFKAERDG
jgi:phage regulator Rha-like protein